MISIDIPQRGGIELHHAVFDINGTLATDGSVHAGVVMRLRQLAAQLSIHLLTAGSHGNLTELEHTLGFPLHVVLRGDEKMRYVQQLGPTGSFASGWIIARRYSEFLFLHQQLKEQYLGVKALEFPGKHLMTSLSSHLLDNRRTALEKYLQVSLHLSPAPLCVY